MRTLRLQATLREVSPLVTRTVDVPNAITLDELHDVLQVALGWTNSHLHYYDTGSVRYSSPFEDWEDDVDERAVRLASLPTIRLCLRPRLRLAARHRDCRHRWH